MDEANGSEWRSTVPGRKQREQGIVVERLREVEVEARTLRPAAVLVLAVPGDGNNHGILAALFLPELRDDLVAAHPRKADIEQDEIRLILPGHFDGFWPTVGCFYLVPDELQEHRHGLSRVHAVI